MRNGGRGEGVTLRRAVGARSLAPPDYAGIGGGLHVEQAFDSFETFLSAPDHRCEIRGWDFERAKQPIVFWSEHGLGFIQVMRNPVAEADGGSGALIRSSGVDRGCVVELYGGGDFRREIPFGEQAAADLGVVGAVGAAFGGDEGGRSGGRGVQEFAVLAALDGGEDQFADVVQQSGREGGAGDITDFFGDDGGGNGGDDGVFPELADIHGVCGTGDRLRARAEHGGDDGVDFVEAEARDGIEHVAGRFAAAEEGAVAAFEHFGGDGGFEADEFDDSVDIAIRFLEQREQFNQERGRRRELRHGFDVLIDFVHSGFVCGLPSREGAARYDSRNVHH